MKIHKPLTKTTTTTTTTTAFHLLLLLLTCSYNFGSGTAGVEDKEEDLVMTSSLSQQQQQEQQEEEEQQQQHQHQQEQEQQQQEQEQEKEQQQQTTRSLTGWNDDFYQNWTNVLQEIVQLNVTPGWINYPRLARSLSLKENLDFFLLRVAEVNNLDSFNISQFYSFHINVYNAFVIRLIVNNLCKTDVFGPCGGPITTIEEIGFDLLRSVWNLDAGKIGGKTFTLDQLQEHLRHPPPPNSIDPRFYSAIVCGSVGAPTLLEKAYTPGFLNDQLNKQMRVFLTNSQKGLSLDTSTAVLTLSPYFKWFEADFTSVVEDGNIIDYLLKGGGVYDFLSNSTIRNFLISQRDSISIHYFAFNWTLNGNAINKQSCPLQRCYPLYALVLTSIGLGIIISLLFTSLIAVYCRLQKRSGYTRLL